MTRRDEAVEPGRLGRAIHRKWDRLGERAYRIEGRHERYYDVLLDAEQKCYCEDSIRSGHMCLHEIKARLIEQDPAIFPHLVALMERKVREERQAAESRASGRTARRTRTAKVSP